MNFKDDVESSEQYVMYLKKERERRLFGRFYVVFEVQKFKDVWGIFFPPFNLFIIILLISEDFTPDFW